METLDEQMEKIQNNSPPIPSFRRNDLQFFIDRDIEILKFETLPTGIKGIDENLEGGFHDGLYVIGAEPGIGKTSLVLQIANEFALNNEYVAFISLEMTPIQLIAKSLSMQSVKNKKTNNVMLDYENLLKLDSLNEKQEQKFNEVLDLYRYSIDPRLSILTRNDLRDAYGSNCILKQDIASLYLYEYEIHDINPVIIIDYIQLLAYYNFEQTTMNAISDYITVLKDISKSTGKPVIVISSLNRSSYDDKTNSMRAFKESGIIEYSADVLIKLTRGATKTEPNMVQKQEIKCNVLKNRFGISNTSFKIEFTPRYSYFE